MRDDPRLFEDFAKLAGGAMGAVQDMGKEARAQMRARLHRMLGDLDLVDREEFEAVREMAAVARAEQERLAKRVEELEARLAAAEKKSAARPRKKPAPKTAD